LPKSFALVITYADPVTAYRMSWYPGAGHVGDRAIRYETTTYLDILRMLNFVT
jgi:D-amino peptidase